MSTWVAVLVALAVGTAISTQSSFSAVMARHAGLWPTAFVVHVVGVFVSLVPLWFYRSQSNWAGLAQTPWYAYLGGALGVVIIAGIAYLVGHVGVTAGVSIVIAAQLTAALLIDHFGWFGITVQPVDWLKLLGVALLIVGARLVLR